MGSKKKYRNQKPPISKDRTPWRLGDGFDDFSQKVTTLRYGISYSVKVTVIHRDRGSEGVGVRM